MLGERIRRLRTDAHMKQSDLAQRLGISASAVGMYEQGRREPPYELLIKLGELFDVSADWLLARDETIERPTARCGDFEQLLGAFDETLRQQEELMFHGRLLDDADIEKIMRAMRLGAEITMREEERGRMS